MLWQQRSPRAELLFSHLHQTVFHRAAAQPAYPPHSVRRGVLSSYWCMTSTTSSPTGQSVFLVHQIEVILAALTQVAGQLAVIASDLDATSQLHRPAAVRTELQERVEQELLVNLCRGKESIAASALAEALSGIMQDAGMQLSVRDTNGRHVQGARGLVFRMAPQKIYPPSDVPVRGRPRILRSKLFCRTNLRLSFRSVRV